MSLIIVLASQQFETDGSILKLAIIY